MIIKMKAIFAAFFVHLLILSTSSMAADVSFEWAPNTDATTGYKIHSGDMIGIYTRTVDVGMGVPIDGKLTATVHDVPVGVKLNWVCTAYNPDEESDYSNVVTYRVPWGKPGKPGGFGWKK